MNQKLFLIYFVDVNIKTFSEIAEQAGKC